MGNQEADILHPKKTLIIGHQGRMGQMLMAEALAHNLTVVGLDQPLTQAKLNLLDQDIDLALFCVPALVLEDVLKSVCPFLSSDCIVADITSVKVMPMQLMASYAKGPVVGTHPLFGPTLDRTQELPVALTAGQKSSPMALSKTSAFFSQLGFTVFTCAAEIHDTAMACLQNLNFITNVVYFAFLADRKELLPFLTPSFKRRLQAAKKMLTEDAKMFTGLFEANAKSQGLVRQYSKLLNLAAAGEIELLCKKAQWWWKDEHKI